MKDEIVDAELTPDLQAFLERRGYTHIFSLGIEPREINDAHEPETGKANFWLCPVKADDERFEAENPEHLVQGIDDPEIVKMAAGKEDIQFMVKVPLVDYNDYLAKR